MSFNYSLYEDLTTMYILYISRYYVNKNNSRIKYIINLYQICIFIDHISQWLERFY